MKIGGFTTCYPCYTSTDRYFNDSFFAKKKKKYFVICKLLKVMAKHCFSIDPQPPRFLGGGAKTKNEHFQTPYASLYHP